MKIEDVKKLFPENWDKPLNAIGYCYATYCHNTEEFYIGKKTANKFVEAYYGGGAAIKWWKSQNYNLDHWAISWATNPYELLDQECAWVEKGKEIVSCTNIRPGGSPVGIGKKHSEETKQKIREKALLVQHTPLSQETKDRISASNIGKHNKTAEERKAVGDFHRGRKRSEETCKKIGDSKRGANNPNFGKPRDEETKKKISEAQKGRKFTPEHREKLRLARLNYLEKVRGGQNNGKK